MQRVPSTFSDRPSKSHISPSFEPLELEKEDQVDRSQATKSWLHLVAGASGGVATALLTSPLDVLRTRLQSDYYRWQVVPHSSLRRPPSTTPFRFLSTTGNHFRETFQILFSIPRLEGWRGLFRGLGPGLTGVVPASAIKFYTYGNGKRIISQTFGLGKDAAIVHIGAAAISGVVTGTATNPIWLVKTRLQLDKSRAEQVGGVVNRRYKNSLDCVAQVLRQEGPRGLYRGLSASYLGVAESTMHLALYEQMKMLIEKRRSRVLHSHKKTYWDHALDWAGTGSAAGISKFFAVTLGYPHEVVRTRLRQAPMSNGVQKYNGIVHCFSSIWREEGFMALYGGLTAHLLRAIPSAAIMLGVYEFVLKLA